jgi:nitrate/nitrite-specific signal transduction histidine kinase
LANAKGLEVSPANSPNSEKGEVISNVLDHDRTGHFGLPGMRERAEQVGAELTIWSRLGTGTEIAFEPGA